MATAEQVRDIPVIDADTHVVEPYDLWTSRVSTTKWGDQVPHVVWDEEKQLDVWVSGDDFLWLGAVAGQAGYEKHHPDFPPRFSDLKVETWRAPDRLRMMTKYGIQAAILYPNIAGFGAGNFARVAGSNGELALELVKAYNDFLIDFCSEDPRRYIPVMGVPFWDIDLSIAEMERSAVNGHRGIIFSQQPDDFHCPMLADRHWDRLWAAAQEMELSVNFHIGSGNVLEPARILPPEEGRYANATCVAVFQFLNNIRAISSMIVGGICHRFPELKIVSVESGIGWMPFALQNLDWMWKETGMIKQHPEYDLLPSEYFRRQMYGCFWFEHGPTLDAALEYLGDEHVLFETDFPHAAGLVPGPASHTLPPNEFIATHLSYLPEPTLRRVLHDNAAALYKID
jgi:predicted TIM-barrel fold metal-dependent hydrolase